MKFIILVKYSIRVKLYSYTHALIYIQCKKNLYFNLSVDLSDCFYVKLIQ